MLWGSWTSRPSQPSGGSLHGGDDARRLRGGRRVFHVEDTVYGEALRPETVIGVEDLQILCGG